MKTPDQTLSQFLEQFEIGIMSVLPDEELKQMGSPDAELPNIEAIKFDLVRPFEIGELVSFASSYLIRSGYRELTVNHSINKELLKQPVLTDELFHTALLSAKSGDANWVMITVAYNNSYAQFIKSY